jgi:hypothetical protein
MSTRRLALAGLLLLALVLPAGAAQAAGPFKGATPRMTPIDAVLGDSIRDDGQSKAVTADGLALVDVVTGAREPVQLPRPDCHVTAVHRTTVLTACGAGGDLIAGTVPPSTWTPVNAHETVASDQTITADAIGDHWVRLELSEYHGAGTSYVSRDDGRTVQDLDLGGHALPQLDRPDLAAPLCAPLRRRLVAADLGRVYAPYAFDAGVGLHVGPDRRHENPLALQRCGGRPQKPVCVRDCTPVGLGAGMLLWQSGTDGFVRNVAARRTVRVHVPHRRVRLALVGSTVLAGVWLPKQGDVTRWARVTLPWTTTPVTPPAAPVAVVR